MIPGYNLTDDPQPKSQPKVIGTGQDNPSSETKSLYTPTVVVGLPSDTDLAQITALWYLPSVWTKEDGSRVLTVPSIGPSPGDDVRRYDRDNDLEIVSNFDGEAYPHVAPYELRGRRAIFTRFGKFAQATYIRQKFRNLDRHSLQFVHLNCWKHWKDIPSSAGPLIVVKSENGARGISHLFFTTSLTTPSRVGQCLAELRQNGETLSRPDVPAEDLSTNMLAIMNAGVPEDKGPAAIFPRRGDKHLNEGYLQLMSGSNVWQEVQQDIVAEFRVITDHRGHPTYFLRRDRNCVDEGMVLRSGETNARIAMARGNNAKIDSWGIVAGQTDAPTDKSSTTGLSWLRTYLCVDFPSDGGALLKTELAAGVVKGIQSLDLPLHALDIYVTSDYRWGIFEFCPQFGTASVPNSFLHDISKAFIEETVDKLQRQ